MTQKHSALRVVSRDGIGIGYRQTARIRPKRRIALHLDRAIHLLDMSDICRCEADSNYCHLHTMDGRKVIVSKTLGSVLKALPGSLLVRVHQSHAINIAMISEVYGNHVVLTNGERIPMARRRRSELEAVIQQNAVSI